MMDDVVTLSRTTQLSPHAATLDPEVRCCKGGQRRWGMGQT